MAPKSEKGRCLTLGLALVGAPGASSPPHLPRIERHLRLLVLGWARGCGALSSSGGERARVLQHLNLLLEPGEGGGGGGERQRHRGLGAICILPSRNRGNRGGQPGRAGPSLAPSLPPGTCLLVCNQVSCFPFTCIYVYRKLSLSGGTGKPTSPSKYCKVTSTRPRENKTAPAGAWGRGP